MATIFWDQKGILLIDCLEKGKRVTGEYYADILCQLRESVKKNRRGLLTKGVLLLHDNAPAHKSKLGVAALAECEFEILNHPPYSPDLAPSDYFLLPKLKKKLRGRRFEDEDGVKSAVEGYFATQSEEFFFSGIELLLKRSEKCVGTKGEYIEK